jgi:dihydropteroate synthase
MDLSALNAEDRLYLRPIHFIESPQQHDGESAQLAGTMLWFCAVELIVRRGGETARRIIRVSEWETVAAGLPARASAVFANITASRPALQLGSRTIRLDQPQVMAILNVTPDSFSDGGKHVDAAAAVSAGVAMSAAGAALIDVGGESTRPGAPLLWEGDEIARIDPVIQGLAAAGTAISVDTRKAAVMEAALASGAAMINDISALLYDDRSIEVAKASSAPVVLMHAPGQGSNPHKGAAYDNALFDIYDWLELRVEAVVAAGIARERLIVDPGLGFGYGEVKSLADDLSLINNLALFHGLGCPILFGASRKRMIGALSNEAAADQRLGGSLFLAMKAIEQGAQIVRVHDVAETVQAIHVWRGLRDAALTARV